MRVEPQSLKEEETKGQAIFVQSDDRKIDGETSLRNRAESDANGLGKKAFGSNAKKEDTANMPERIIKYAHILSSQIKGTDKTLINIKKQNSETINYLDRKINYHFSNSIKERKQFNINTERANTIVKRNTNWVDLFDKELLIKNTFIAVNIVHRKNGETHISQLNESQISDIICTDPFFDMEAFLESDE